MLYCQYAAGLTSLAGNRSSLRLARDLKGRTPGESDRGYIYIYIDLTVACDATAESFVERCEIRAHNCRFIENDSIEG